MHFSNNQEIKARTSHEWLGVGATIGALVNRWAFRDDLVVMLGKNTESGAPALFNPISSEIEVNIERAFGAFADPEKMGDFTERLTQLDYPVASGAIFHEALHARFSRFDLAQMYEELKERGRERDFAVVHYLEEGRIEALGVKYNPENRVLLRSCAMDIVLDDLKSKPMNSAPRSVASLCALTMARVDAGVLDEDDIEALSEIVYQYLDAEVVEKLRSVWVRFQAHEDHYNYAPLLDLAKEWNDILDEVEPSGDSEGGEGSGEGGIPGESEDNEANADFTKAIREALEEVIDQIKVSNQGEIYDAQESAEWEEERKARESVAKDRKKAEKVAEEVFAQPASGERPTGKSSSRVREVRKPNSDERVAAVRVAQALEKAKYRERGETDIVSVAPPGRLRTRAAVQGAAMKARGIHQQVEAWRRTKRKQTEDPTLRVGVMVDISGSMGRAMEPMATTAWVMSEAVRRVQGKCAMVYYGEDVFATLKPGQHLTDVKVYSAPDGTEEFEKAYLALDGIMDFSNAQDGARLLVVVSDGHYRADQQKKAEQCLRKADRSGTAILWITFDGSSAPRYYLSKTNGKVVNFDKESTASTVAVAIGQAASEALAQVGKRNA